jgi:hypothetical protein
MTAGPRVGDVLVLTEPDYAYGVGPIIVQITQVVELVAYRGEPWWSVVAMAANGTPESHGGWVDRVVYVRQAAIPRSRQDPGA